MSRNSPSLSSAPASSSPWMGSRLRDVGGGAAAMAGDEQCGTEWRGSPVDDRHNAPLSLFHAGFFFLDFPRRSPKVTVSQAKPLPVEGLTSQPATPVNWPPYQPTSLP